jgi:hypothetical protein
MTACGGRREDLRIKYMMEVTKWEMGVKKSHQR